MAFGLSLVQESLLGCEQTQRFGASWENGQAQTEGRAVGLGLGVKPWGTPKPERHPGCNFQLLLTSRVFRVVLIQEHNIQQNAIFYLNYLFYGGKPKQF